MNKQTKEQFINFFTKEVVEKILNNIDKMPEDWDGFELRQYIADTFKDEIIAMSKSRKRKYNNTVITNNL